ncbi:MAG: rod shape-determining protein MreC [Gemmatimonadaceae bacterium]
MPRGSRGDSRADTVVAIGCVLLALTLLILPDGPRDAVAGAIRGNLLGPLAAMQERAARARSTLVLNDSLRVVADSVVARSQRLEAVTAENDRLRELLGLGRALRWGYVPAEALVGRRLGEEHTLLLSAGAVQGVSPLSAVVTAEGLVGMVQQVDPTTSVAITWPHPDFRVSAVSLDGSSFGIVSAHGGVGADRYLLELHGVPYRAPLRAGSPIVSSGLGGVYPRGLLIGTVVRELRRGTSWARSYLVRPTVRPADVTAVMILSPERSAEGVESVWEPAAQEMLRRVRAAADSVAAAADRARSDSAPPDSAGTEPR